MASVFSWRHAIRKAKLEPTTKLVLYTIDTRMAADGSGCFPSYATIAEDSGLGRRTVIDHVKRSVAAGFLEKLTRLDDDGEHTSNLYRAHMPGGGAADAPPSAAAAPGVVQQPHPKRPSEQTREVSPQPPKGAEPVNGAFEDFWQAYPNKVGKPVALRAFLKAGPEAGVLMVGLDRWKRSQGWLKDKGRFIPHPSTFLNQRRWEDMPFEMAAPQTDLERANAEFAARFIAPTQQKQIA